MRTHELSEDRTVCPRDPSRRDVLLGAAGSMLFAPSLAAAIAADQPDNRPRDFHEALASLPDNSWVDLGLPWRGGHEVPACFDQANRLFFKYGGCGDSSPRVNVAGSPRPDETYGNSCWVVNMATGDWEMRRPNDVSFPADRPANGCSRSYCYDPKRQLIWMYGGISNGGGGGDQWDMWSYDGKNDQFQQANSTGRPQGGDECGGDVFIYDSLHDIIVMPRGQSTWVYSPQQNAWEERKTPDGPGRPGHYGSMTFDEAAGRLVYPVCEPTGNTSDAHQRPPATPATFWRKDGSGEFHEHAFVTWTYDASTNRWEKLTLEAGGPNPSPRWRFGLTYDARNRVVLLVGGSTDTWDDTEAYYNDVWVLDTVGGRWSKTKQAGSKPNVSQRECRHCAYAAVDNVVLWLPAGERLWGYRYRA